MRFVVITGPSGAGKTLALHSFEDAGYYTSDNLPPALLPALFDFCEAAGFERGAAVIDIRSGSAFAQLPAVIELLRERGSSIEVLYLDAGDETLVHRYKETRRPHPLLKEGQDPQRGITEAIEMEREELEAIRALSDSVLDTSPLSPMQIRDAIHSAYAQETRPGLLITITSFGFKYGLPIDADLVFDVRFLKNPHYVPSLKRHDGREIEVAEFVHSDPNTEPFFDKMYDLIAFALPQYKREGKAYLNIAIGCTGGKHRSVVLTLDLARQLEKDGHPIVIRHRDIGRNRAQEVADTEIEGRQTLKVNKD